MADLLTVAGMARSTFFYHQALLNQPDKHAQLKEVISARFTEHKRRFGYRRIRMLLQAEGWVVSTKLVLKLMRQMGLKSKVRQPRKYSSYRGTVSHIADNVLGRDFEPDAPNHTWVSDVTEFRVAGTKVYLSPIMDLCDRSIIAYAVSRSPSTALTAQSLSDALAAWTPDAGLLVHTDQGFQYQHSSWRDLVTGCAGVQSMSRKGNCYDNAVMENFFGHMKSEMFHGEYFASVEDFLAEVEDYIDWYNTKRVQQRLKGLTPMQYRNQILEAIPA